MNNLRRHIMMQQVSEKEPVLPPEYQKVEYIETTRNTFTFANYAVLGADFCMRVKLQFLEVGAISGTRREIIEYNSTYGMGCWFAWSGVGTIRPKYTGDEATKMYMWDLNRPLNYTTIDGYGNGRFYGGSLGNFDTETQYFCFGARQSFNSQNKRQRIAYLEFYNAVYAKLYACYRKSDNAIGMYDVTNSSFVNFGSGDWTVGQPIQ